MATLAAAPLVQTTSAGSDRPAKRSSRHEFTVLIVRPAEIFTITALFAQNLCRTVWSVASTEFISAEYFRSGAWCKRPSCHNLRETVLAAEKDKQTWTDTATEADTSERQTRAHPGSLRAHARTRGAYVPTFTHLGMSKCLTAHSCTM